MKPLLALATLPCALCALAATPAHAADSDDRFELRLGAMNVDTDNTVRGSTEIGGERLSSAEDFDREIQALRDHREISTPG